MLRERDRLCVQKSKYKSSECGKAFRRRARKKRKGIKREGEASVCALGV
jgi:hypothetical protein